MTAPDRPWCAWCGREISDEAVRLRRLPRPGSHDDGEWFCDWTCEAHAADPCMTNARNRHPRKAQP